MMTLGKKIKELRIAHNESLQQLAEAIGISKAHLWELERNNSQNPSLETLKNLAQHFKVSIDSLVDNNAPSIHAFGREFENLTDESLEILKTLAAKLEKKQDNNDTN